MTQRPGREPWPWILAGLLAAMVSGSLGFLAISLAHPDPLVVLDDREAERVVSERVRAARRARTLAWDIRMRAELARGSAWIAVDVVDQTGARLVLEDVAVTRVRPAEGGLDIPLRLEPHGDSWRGRVPLPLPGRWHLRVRAERGSEAVERTFALWSPGDDR